MNEEKKEWIKPELEKVDINIITELGSASNTDGCLKS